jgi:hypothetical protein
MARRLRIYKPKVSYRSKKHILVVGLVIGLSSLVFTNRLARQLREREQNEVALWSYAMQNVAYLDINSPLFQYIINANNTIPFIMTDENLQVLGSHLIPSRILNDRKLLRGKLEQMAAINPPFEASGGSTTFTIFYDQSSTLKSLYYFPYIQMGIIAVFVVLSFVAFSSSKQDEQNRVWIGMAKETAHQLGTPTSSLLGWIEYLRSQGTEELVVDEMNKDLTRLLKIVERFSKIGAVTQFLHRDVVDVVGGTVDYFRSRIPKNVELRYIRPGEPVYAMINDALFEWVIENLLKNALDALQGKGEIKVKVDADEKNVHIDVEDTGKGMAKTNFKRIFEPGFTTKTRGWGLGLSLSRRIIEEYHKGRIFVLESEIERGTKIRVILRKDDTM